MKNSNWYEKWHGNREHALIHWVIFILIAGIVGINLISLIRFNVEESSLAQAEGGTVMASSLRTDPNLPLANLTRQILNQSRDYKLATLDQKRSLLGSLRDLALQRKNLMLQQLVSNPKGVLNNSINSTLLARIPVEIQNLIEQKTTINGKFTWLHADGNNNQSINTFTLTDNTNKEYTLHFADIPNLLSDDSATVSGVKIDDHVIVDTATKIRPNVLGANTPTVRKVAVILINFVNNPVQPYTTDYARSVTFTGTGSVNNYYQEDSFGQLSLTGALRPDGDVFGWYTIPYTPTYCDTNTWAAAGKAAAMADGFVSSRYNAVITAFPQTGACPWWGLGSVGGNPGNEWINGNYQLRVVGHEFGHNLGRYHSHSMDCTNGGVRVTLGGSCGVADYGDPFDIMGGSTGHYNAFQKSISSAIPNWWATNNAVNVTADGNYTIAPLESNLTSPQYLRIARDSSNYYYVDFRQNIGYDNGIPATGSVQVHYVNPSNLNSSNLLDLSPWSGGFGDAGLPAGQTYTDEAKGIQITTVSTTSTQAVLHVHFGTPVCVNASPGLSLTPGSQTIGAGQTVSYTLTLSNRDNSACSSSTFTTTPTLPAGWIATPATLTQTLTPYQSVVTTINVTAPTTGVLGNYSITQTAVNNSNATLAASVSSVATVVVPDTTAPVTFITSPISGTSVSGVVNVTATASDNVGVTEVSLYANNTLVGIAGKGGLFFSWNTAGYSSVTLTTRAKDAANNVGISAPVSVTVGGGSTPPPPQPPPTTPPPSNKGGNGHININPNIISFSATSGGATPLPKSVPLNNSGTVLLDWTAATNQNWCHVTPISGSIGVGSSTLISVSVDSPSNVGSFDCTLTIISTNADNSPQIIPIVYTVLGGGKVTPPASPPIK